jgi:hypothetical protein
MSDSSASSSSSSSSSKADVDKWSHLYAPAEKVFSEPVLLAAEIVHGFKRGSKELGIPTANLSMDQIGDRVASIETGRVGDRRQETGDRR